MDLANEALPGDTVGLLDGIASTRAIRLYRDEPIPLPALRAILFAASRAPSGSNRQPFRFLVLTDGPRAAEAKRMIAESARRAWGFKRATDGYDARSGQTPGSPKARMDRTMQSYIEAFDRVPALVLPCLARYRAPTSFEGASIYPACQNVLLAARAVGYGGVLTGWHFGVETELRELLQVPEDVYMAATITLGRPRGHQGPGTSPPAPRARLRGHLGRLGSLGGRSPGIRHTSAGPPPTSSGSSSP
jgi:nitroreductase